MHKAQFMTLYTKFQFISIYFAGDINNSLDLYFAVHVFFLNTQNKNSTHLVIFDSNTKWEDFFSWSALPKHKNLTWVNLQQKLQLIEKPAVPCSTYTCNYLNSISSKSLRTISRTFSIFREFNPYT